MIYYGTRLSENISRREPEGYLFCLNVPVARTGTQEYLPEELGIPPGELHSRSTDGMISVFRPEEEVFSPETIASFEGMPVTDNHPATEEGVTLENNRYLQKGHAHNIRRGRGAEADLLLADLASAGEKREKVSSKKVGDIAISYSTSSSSSSATVSSTLADLSETTYGLQLLSLIRLHRMPMYVP